MTPIPGVFGPRVPDVSDRGYQHVVDDGNVARRAVITFTGSNDQGSFNNMFDLDDTTRFGVLTGAADNTDFFVTLDFLRKQTKAVVSAYFAASTASGGITVVVKFQHSEDGTTYTDMATATQVGSGETTKNYGGQIDSFRYLRFKMNATGGGSGHANESKIYFLRVANG